MRKHCNRPCRTKLKEGVALLQTYGGIPDFPGGTVMTLSPAGPGRLVKALKCPKCGRSWRHPETNP